MRKGLCLLLLAGCGNEPATPPQPAQSPRTVRVKAQVEAPSPDLPTASPSESLALESPTPRPSPTPFRSRPIVVPKRLPGPERASSIPIGPPDDPSSAAS